MTPAGGRRRILVLMNPSAGSKVGIPTNRIGEQQVREAMARHGLGDDLIVTSAEDQAAAETDRAVAQGYDIVVAAGGDGTAGSVARRLLGKRTALGILPLGTAMNIARSIGVPRDIDAAAAAIAAGRIEPIDIGSASSGHVGELDFFEAGSVGMTAAIFSEGQRIDRGEWDGLVDLVRVIVRFRPRRMRLRLDEKEVETRAMMVTVANGPYTGLALAVAPDAAIDDGLFDVRVYRHFSSWEALRHLIAIAAGRRAYHPRVSTYRAARVVIESRHPLPARADAVDLGTTPVTFAVRPRSLRVVVGPEAPALGDRAVSAAGVQSGS